LISKGEGKVMGYFWTGLIGLLVIFNWPENSSDQRYKWGYSNGYAASYYTMCHIPISDRVAPFRVISMTPAYTRGYTWGYIKGNWGCFVKTIQID